MTSSNSSSQPNVPHATSASTIALNTISSSSSGAVPAQLPGRSYANATKTATSNSSTPAGASVSSHNANAAIDSPVNGGNQMAQGNAQVGTAAQNGTAAGAEHGKKPSVVISASGASGYIPNGGPVSLSSRPPISFGSINSSDSPLPTASVPAQTETSSLTAPPRDPRVISPTHSPSPIPQPPVSGGHRPPSSVNQSNGGMTFGSMGGDSEQMRQAQMQAGQHGPALPGHERRQSSQSMQQSDMSNMSRGFVPGSGRGRGYAQPQQFGMPSPAQNFRQPSNPRPGLPSAMSQQYQQGMQPGSPYNRRGSPAVNPSQPYMQQPHAGGSSSMQYGGYPQQMSHQQHHQPNMYPHYDPNSGYYQPYWYGQPSQSPRPPYPSPYNTSQGSMQPPFHPPASMSRSTSQASERPTSSMGQSQTPSMSNVPPTSHTPASSQHSQNTQSAFVKPKKSSAIKITDAQGNPIILGKRSPTPSAPVQPQAPVIVSTPNGPTPPPRAPSSQHNRSESKPAKSAEETKNAFQEQVKRQMEEERRKIEAAEALKTSQETAATNNKSTADAAKSEGARNDPVLEATAEAEKAAAADAGDKSGVDAADAAASAVVKDDDEEKTAKEETEEERLKREEDERLEAEIAEMEAAEKEEEEREKAFQEKRNKEKAEAAKKQVEADANADAELKRQEREAEEREEQRERERNAEKSTDEPDEQSQDMFAELKKPTLGPGASATDNDADTTASGEADQASPMAPPAVPATARSIGAQKPKPANIKIETAKRVEPAEPTPGMQALKSSRFLTLKEEPQYPDGFKSPNPAVNQNGARKARAYDKEFLLQFQNVYKEKPSVDWDQKVKDTLGPSDEPGSARSGSVRTPSSNMGRAASGRAGPPPVSSFGGGQMGSFGGGQMRTLPTGTTSEQRFAASQGARPGMGAPGPMGGRVPSQLGMGAPAVGMSRNNSSLAMGNMGAGSPRQASARGGKASSRRGDRIMSKKEEADMAAKMPLTASMEIAPLQKSTTGWKAPNVGQAIAVQTDLSGNMAPDMVQRKVKAALNKMTPEKFDKISDQILEIAAQSKSETDGRTLRQVIQLTFEKACDEAHWAGMYAQFCHRMLTTMSAEIRDETIKDKAGNPVVGGALFRKYLLNRCQEEFERGWQVNLPEKPEGESQEAALLSDEYYVAAAAKRRGLGLIQFIGQLYRLRMLSLRITHECVLKLLNFEGNPDEAAVENLTTLLKAVGSTMEEDDQGSTFLNAYFDRIDNVLLKNDALPSRPRFMVMDLIDLRKANWKGKDDSKGPKTLTQIHQEADAAAAKAEQERLRSSARGGGGGGRMPPGRAGDARNFSGNMAPPVDYQRTNVAMDDLRRLQARNQSQRTTGGGLGPSLGPGGSMLGARSGSKRGAANLGPGSGNTTRTSTPPVDNKEKKDEPASQNAFSALAALDPPGEPAEEAPSRTDAASPPAAQDHSTPAAATETAE